MTGCITGTEHVDYTLKLRDWAVYSFVLLYRRLEIKNRQVLDWVTLKVFKNWFIDFEHDRNEDKNVNSFCLKI